MAVAIALAGPMSHNMVTSIFISNAYGRWSLRHLRYFVAVAEEASDAGGRQLPQAE